MGEQHLLEQNKSSRTLVTTGEKVVVSGVCSEQGRKCAEKFDNF